MTAEALDYAKRLVADLRSNPIDLGGIEVFMLDKAENRRFARTTMKAWVRWNDVNMKCAIDFARQGWDLADEALREVIIDMSDGGQELPAALAAYRVEIVRGTSIEKPHGPKKSDQFLRNIAIATMVLQVAERFSLSPTGRSPRSPSACYIVAEAVGATYPTVAEIWRQLSKAIGPPKSPRAA